MDTKQKNNMFVALVVNPHGELQGRPPAGTDWEAFDPPAGRLTLTKAVRANCLQCAGSISEVSRCTMVDCPLFCFRGGFDPYRGKRGRPSRARNDG